MGTGTLRWTELALLSAPWAGVGLFHLVLGRSLGAGIQPAYIPLLALVVTVAWSTSRNRDDNWFGLWTIALGWTLITTTWTWTRDVVGLAGDVPWEKSLKQAVLWCFFVTAAVSTAVVVRARGARAFERAATLGLGLAAVVGLIQAVSFHGGIPGGSLLERIVSSNPSIASGSGELYLGDRFVGIPRVRGPFPEPLHFGSYLVAAVPISVAGAWVHHGRARAWRVGVALLGALCLVMTFSRGAWAGAFVVVLAVGVGMARRILPAPPLRVGIASAVGCVAVGLVAAPVLTGHGLFDLPGLVAQRVAQSFAAHDMSNLTRFWSWRVAWDLFAERPVQGIGWGGFGFWYFERAGSMGSGAHFGWPMVNNLPLQLLAELGAAGFLLWAAVLTPGMRALGASRPAPEAFLLACAVAGTLVHLLTFSQWDLPHLWILFGAAVGAGSRIPRVV